MPWKERLHILKERKELRSLPGIVERIGPRVRLQGLKLDLSSNDYLGLSQDPRLKAAAIRAAEEWGVGSTGSRLMSGDLPLHRRLESAIARWKGTEAALFLGSGYLANIGVISALGALVDTILVDRLCHASIIDGVRLSGRRFRRFRHNDLAHLDELLAKASNPSRVLVVVEGVYSMDGDICPLRGLLRLRKRYGFVLMVDDAHGIGALGRSGVGVVAPRLANEVDVQVGTFGKALGGYGAFVACRCSIRDFLINSMRSFIFSTAPPPPVVAAADAALKLVMEEGGRRRHLARLAAWLRGVVRDQLGLFTPSRSHIVPIILGDNRRALEAAELLQQAGFYCRAIRPPTVPRGTARIRLSLSAAMAQSDLEPLIAVLKGVLGGG